MIIAVVALVGVEREQVRVPILLLAALGPAPLLALVLVVAVALLGAVVAILAGFVAFLVGGGAGGIGVGGSDKLARVTFKKKTAISHSYM